MKKLILLTAVLLALSFSAFAQEKEDGHDTKATDADKIATFDADGKIKRGDEIGDSKMVSLKKVLKNPEKYDGKTVRLKGFVVRSCKKEGCWAELGATKDAKQSLRVDMKAHSFFIPLQSVGFKALSEGKVNIKTLTNSKIKFS